MMGVARATGSWMTRYSRLPRGNGYEIPLYWYYQPVGVAKTTDTLRPPFAATTETRWPAPLENRGGLCHHIR